MVAVSPCGYLLGDGVLEPDPELGTGGGAQGRLPPALCAPEALRQGEVQLPHALRRHQLPQCLREEPVVRDCAQRQYQPAQPGLLTSLSPSLLTSSWLILLMSWPVLLTSSWLVLLMSSWLILLTSSSPSCLHHRGLSCLRHRPQPAYIIMPWSAYIIVAHPAYVITASPAHVIIPGLLASSWLSLLTS